MIKKILLLLKVEKETNFLSRAKEIVSRCRRSNQWVSTVATVSDTEDLMRDIAKVRGMSDEYDQSKNVTQWSSRSGS